METGAAMILLHLLEKRVQASLLFHLFRNKNLNFFALPLTCIKWRHTHAHTQTQINVAAFQTNCFAIL